jgi:hypothetical protein
MPERSDAVSIASSFAAECHNNFCEEIIKLLEAAMASHDWSKVQEVIARLEKSEHGE